MKRLLFILLILLLPLCHGNYPETIGSNVCSNVLDLESNESIVDFKVISIINDSTDMKFEYYSMDDNIIHIEWLPALYNMDDGNFTMIIRKEGYKDSEPFIFSSFEFRDWYNESNECFTNHTFYLEPIVIFEENESQDNLTSINSSDVFDDPIEISEKSNVMVIIIVSLVFLLLGVFSYFKFRKKFF